MLIQAKITRLSQRRYSFRLRNVSRVARKEKQAALVRIRDKTVKYANDLIVSDQQNTKARKNAGMLVRVFSFFDPDSGYVDRKLNQGLQSNIDRDIARIFGRMPKATGRIKGNTVIITLPAPAELNNPKRLQKMVDAFMRREWKKEQRKLGRHIVRAGK